MAYTNSNRSQINLLINGTEYKIHGDDVFLPLAQYLRQRVHLPGTKVVCAEGDCGACTVLVARWDKNSWAPFQTLNSCIAPVYLFDLASIVTVEGLAFSESLNEVQTKMREFHGGQCGYCTPGIVCALSGLADESCESKTAITEKKARNHLTGNLCRCTGYKPILEAAVHIDLNKWQPLAERYYPEAFLGSFQKLFADTVTLEGETQMAFIPKRLQDALDFKEKNSSARIVAGSTDIGVLNNKGKIHLDKILVLSRLTEIETLDNQAGSLWVGAKTTLTDFENFVEKIFPEFSRLIRVFASPQIKNQGTILGNVLNGSPIGDSIPGLLALNADIHLLSNKGTRIVPLTSFYQGYKKLDFLPNEIALGISIPHLAKSYSKKFYKVALRKDLDISAVTFAAVLKIADGKILDARIAIGGVGPTVSRLTAIEDDFNGKDFCEETFTAAGKKIRQYIKPISDLRATEQYRLKVAENLFHKCFIELRDERAEQCP